MTDQNRTELFRELLYECGLDQKGFSNISGLSHVKVRDMACGRNKIPDWVIDRLKKYKKQSRRIFQ